MTLQPLDALAARHLIDTRGAVLVDVRGPDEHARERIAGARSLPLDRLRAQAPDAGSLLAGAPAVVFHCRSGQRTAQYAAWLAGCAPCPAYVLEGGLDGWKRAGLPVLRDAAQPLELQRQVQITAGTLVALGTALGAGLSPWFLLLPAFVGCGLVFAGVSGFCGMARLLLRMPWNRRAAAA
ncbi:Rhodanese-related sulfurtransferase [Oryzisolibacter propanilivorax]|uniref:Rhodanese-related sulfurtransferase n=1 Tax=Oryzisolibacter propanilivorax TaxID=1527607 RepID=A0A1G9SZ91_9BURK|nr:rhodanese family protein [Oryzisolibacter propanilivorax]SDM40769.1 Rhodanese-related sulfurtransferase [Oryzisolibacter propanilivorax]